MFDEHYLIHKIAGCCEVPRLQEVRPIAKRIQLNYEMIVINLKINVITNQLCYSHLIKLIVCISYK